MTAEDRRQSAVARRSSPVFDLRQVARRPSSVVRRQSSVVSVSHHHLRHSQYEPQEESKNDQHKRISEHLMRNDVHNPVGHQERGHTKDQLRLNRVDIFRVGYVHNDRPHVTAETDYQPQEQHQSWDAKLGEHFREPAFRRISYYVRPPAEVLSALAARPCAGSKDSIPRDYPLK